MTVEPLTRDELLDRARQLGVALDPGRFPIRRLWAQRRSRTGDTDDRMPSAPLAPGEERSVVLDTPQRLNRIGVKLRTFGSTNTAVTLSLLRIGEDGTATTVAAERLSPVIDDVWVELAPGATEPGRFVLRVHDAHGTVAPAPQRAGADDEPAWFAELAEPRPIDLTSASDGLVVRVDDPAEVEFAWELPWWRDGYSVARTDGVPFDAIVSGGGRYVPAEQLKRIPFWPFTIDDTDVAFLDGESGFGIRSADGMSVTGTMTAETMTVTVKPAIAGSIEVRTDVDREAFVGRLPRFIASDQTRAQQLTRLYWERALSWPFRDYTASTAGWKHWLTRMLSWTDTEGSAAQAADLADTVQDPEGWVWTRTDTPGWPFPDPARYDTRHPSASLSFVSAIATHYAWTGDRGFLDAMLPRARRAIDHILDAYAVRDGGLLVNRIPDQDGQAGSIGSHYWDIVPGGGRDAYANVLLSAALRQLARLEEHVGDAERADELGRLADRVHAAFSDAFWDEAANRFVQNIDVAGTVHDYGATYLNLEAAAAGLGTVEQTRRMIDWLDAGRTELTDRVVLVPPGGAVVPVAVDSPLEQAFAATAPFRTVAALITADRPDVSFTLALLAPDGTTLASRLFSRWWDRGWASFDAGDRPPGAFRIRLTAHTDGVGWQRGQPGPHAEPDALSIAAVSAHRPGPADVYTAWEFAPRATTRRNDFWYTFGWSGVETEFGDQLQDGGTALYISGFDIEARARVSADLAWRRLIAVLDRAEAPDRLCGGAPLSRGERPQAILPGQVGVDVPFPESGLAPFSALPAFLGLDPRPEGLVIRPNLPGDLEHFGVENLRWRGRRLRIVAHRDRVTVDGDGRSLEASVAPGDVVTVRVAGDDAIELHHRSPTKGA